MPDRYAVRAVYEHDVSLVLSDETVDEVQKFVMTYPTVQSSFSVSTFGLHGNWFYCASGRMCCTDCGSIARNLTFNKQQVDLHFLALHTWLIFCGCTHEAPRGRVLGAA